MQCDTDLRLLCKVSPEIRDPTPHYQGQSCSRQWITVRMSLVILADEESNGAGRRAHAVCEAAGAGYCFPWVRQSAIVIAGVASCLPSHNPTGQD